VSGAPPNDPTMPLDAKATGNTPVDDASPVDTPHSNGKSHPPSDKPEELIPDRDALVGFVDVMFRNARRDGFVSFRVFVDNGKNKRPVLIQALRLDDYEFVPLMLIRAQQAANWYEPAVFCPPVATFKDHRDAKADNIREGVALSTECDQTPAAARATLEALLGPATVVVESGGEWINGETGEIEPKLHLHWRLKKPAATPLELALLYQARALAAKLVGGDPTTNSIVHPLRWPGSWHRKKNPKLARVAALAEDTEIDLAESLERLRAEVGVVEPVSVGSISGRREASDHGMVASALAAIPNDKDPKIYHWEYWNKIGMTIWASTDGSEEGRAAFHDWSAKSPRYDVANTEARWQHYFRSPPTRLGFGSLVWRARQHEPGWRYEDPRGAIATAAIGEFIAQLLRERDEADEADEAGGGASGVPRPNITATPYEWIEPADITPRDWLYGHLLVRKFVTATVAPGGLGKSSLIAAEAVAQVSGMDLVGVGPKEPLRVWLWNLEDPQEETQRKIQAVAKHYGLGREAIGNRLFVDSGRDQSLVVATMTREGPRIARPVVDALVAEIIDKQIDVLIIDPFVSCHEVPENDNTAQDMVVKEWGKVAELGNCAIHLVDHTRKMGSSEAEVTTETSRGAKAKTDACRVVRAVSRMTKEEGEKAGVENHRLYFRTYNDKANLAPPADRSDWFRLESVNLGNGPAVTIGVLGDGTRLDAAGGDSVGVVTQWKWPDAMAGVTDADFEKVAAEIRTGEWRKNAQAGDWVGKAVAKALKLNLNDKTDKAKVAGMIKVWVGRGALVEVNKPDKQRKVKTFVEVAEEV